MRKTTTHPPLPVFGGGCEVQMMVVVASISYSLLVLGQQQAALAPGRLPHPPAPGPRGRADSWFARSHHHRRHSTTPGLISAAVGRTLLGACLLLTKAGCCRRERSAHPDSRQVNARLPPTPPNRPRIDDGRPQQQPPPLRRQAPPHYATPQCHCLRCTRSVRIRKFWCPVSGAPSAA